MLNDLKLTRRGVLAMGSAAAATTLLAAACGEADDDLDRNGDGGPGGQPGGDETPTPEPEPPAPTEAEGTATPDSAGFATAGDEAVVRIEYEGGFLAPEDLVRRTPLVSLFADGQLVYPGPMIEIFPQPAAPNLLGTTLSGKGLRAVAQRIVDTGLFDDGDRDYDATVALIADAPHTIFTVRLADREPVRISVYALEIDGADTDLPDEEVEARRKLRELRDYIASAPTGFPTDHIEEHERQYVIERLQIVTYPWDEVGYDFEVEPRGMEWPLDSSPLTMGEPFRLPGHDARCAVLEGDDLDAMIEALIQANVLTRWEHGDESAFLINRPLLPGEEGCEGGLDPGDGHAGAIDHPTGDDELVMRYEYAGGFVPMEFLVTRFPVASLYGDGRVFTEGAQIMIYPPPALPALALDRVTPEGIQMILREADEAGLLQGEQVWTDLANFIADAPTGVLTIHANGEVHRVEVYAPGATDLDGMVSDEEVAFRQGFDAFVGKFTLAANWLPEEMRLPVPADYPTDRLQIVSQPADTRPSPDVQPNELDWLLDAPLSELGEPYTFFEMARCFVLEGEEFTEVMELMPEATTITRWMSDGEAYVFLIRPLLPDEEGCQEPQF